MQTYIAAAGDTLRKLAIKYHFQIDSLQALNPHIPGIDGSITPGTLVNLPSPGILVEESFEIPVCPSDPPVYQDHWIPLTPIEKMAQTEYDVLIVGSGAGGGAALWRLCEQWGGNGKKIGMVEAGDLLLPSHGRNLPTFDEERLNQFINNPKFSDAMDVDNYPGSAIFRALGGRTILWYGICPRIHPGEFKKHWPFAYKELVPYYLIAEQVMNVNQSYADGSDLQNKLLELLRFRGFPEATDLPIAVNLSATSYGRIQSNVYFSSIAFLAYALNKRPFDLAVNARAVKVLSEEGKTVGVEVMTPDKKKFVIRSKTVILSSGAFETPRLLLHSGIPGEAVGKFMVNHAFLIARAKTNRKQFPEVEGVASILIPQTEERNYQIQVFGPDALNYYWYHYKTKPLMDEVEFRLDSFAVVEPRPDNYVSLDPNRIDEYGVPKLNVQFSFSPQDHAAMRGLYNALQHAVSAMNMELYGNPPICLLTVGKNLHEVGTCRMGLNPATSAANPYGQIHNISGLYVADNSILPHSGAANPTLTTVAVAIRTADHIVQLIE